ncbi:MAG: RlmE family RNA methyltransferase [Thermoplasmata archaeon]|jgi:23S rRNA (uridine2552-2'-O)-methyltransferase|nr:RlmE family RNA methyltransferase [Thermoplasmata archaeon]
MKRQDYYYKKAKRERYKSRASYKLKFIDQRFYIFKKGMNVLDLGASPGGWSQVAYELTYGGNVISVDLKPVRVNGIHFVLGDVLKNETLEKIREKMREIGIDKFDVIISDMSPKISGIKEVDHMQSIELGKRAFEISKNLLKEGGSIVIKLFYGQEIYNFKKDVEKFYDFCKLYTPPASRERSREVYMVCKRFKLST